jgi:hypothetical protein
MHYQSIDDIYAANDSIREKLKKMVSGLGDEQLSALPESEKWTLAQLVEHVALVNEGTTRICAKLLSKAEASGKTGDGRVNISDTFVRKGGEIATIKIDAPDFVQPKTGATIDESLAKLNSNQAVLEDLREKFKQFDGTEAKFPHPFFGDLSAQEWLVLSGAHESRHVKQIRALIEKIG